MICLHESLRIAVDGETVFKGDQYRYSMREIVLTRQYIQEQPQSSWKEAYDFAETVLQSEALHPRYKVTEAMRRVMILPIEQALDHEDPLIRMFFELRSAA